MPKQVLVLGTLGRGKEEENTFKSALGGMGETAHVSISSLPWNAIGSVHRQERSRVGILHKTFASLGGGQPHDTLLRNCRGVTIR